MSSTALDGRNCTQPQRFQHRMGIAGVRVIPLADTARPVRGGQLPDWSGEQVPPGPRGNGRQLAVEGGQVASLACAKAAR